jgi:hypothetical protein
LKGDISRFEFRTAVEEICAPPATPPEALTSTPAIIMINRRGPVVIFFNFIVSSVITKNFAGQTLIVDYIVVLNIPLENLSQLFAINTSGLTL